MNAIGNIARSAMGTFKQKYEPHVREHLAKVYLVMTATAAVCLTGVLLQMFNILDFGGFSALCVLFLVLGLHFYKDDGKNYYTRLTMLLSFGFFSGQLLGKPLQTALCIDSSIIPTALGGTVVTFASLSLAALFAERGKYLFLGGLLTAVINTMGMVALLNTLLNIQVIHLVHLYIGVAVMAALMLFDTQNIIEQCRNGNRDVVHHGMELFCDALSMFRRFIIILTRKDQRKSNSQRH